MGDILISLTGDYEYEAESFNPIIQRFWCTGMSHDEVLRCINAQLTNFEIYDLVGHFEFQRNTQQRIASMFNNFLKFETWKHSK